MRLDRGLACVGTYGKTESVDEFRRRLDPKWIDEALNATGTATIRRRRLPAEVAVWLVLGIALFRERSVTEVANKLNLVLPGPRGPTAAPSSVVQAQTRLGSEPMKWLFRRTADAWSRPSADRHRWRGLALYGMDGSTLRVPDSERNRREFGGPKSGRGESGYPMIRVVGLMALRSHLLDDVSFGPCQPGQVTYAQQLWSSLPDDSLTIVDRGFFGANLLVPLGRGGKNRHWLIRAKENTKSRVLKHLGPGDDLVEMEVSGQARKKDPTLPKTWQARAIRYQANGFRPQTVLTSLLDPEEYPAREVSALYHERWELELGYDEIKTEMLAREETIRSRSPERVRQEMWGIFLAYNLIRVEMERIADEAHVAPTRISFVASIRLICDEWLWCAIASPGAIPAHLRDLRAAVAAFVLPPRRSERAYPRAVKIKMSSYPRKRPSSSGGLK